RDERDNRDGVPASGSPTSILKKDGLFGRRAWLIVTFDKERSLVRIRWIKLIVGAVAAEIGAILILVCLVAVFGPHEAKADQVYAEKLGVWVGPLAGALLGFLGALWVARPLEKGH